MEQLLAALVRALLRVVEVRERPHAVLLEGAVVEQDARHHERAGERAASGLVGAGDEAGAELAVDVRRRCPVLFAVPLRMGAEDSGRVSRELFARGDGVRLGLGRLELGLRLGVDGSPGSAVRSRRPRAALRPPRRPPPGAGRRRPPGGPRLRRSASHARAPSSRPGRAGSRAWRGSRRRSPSLRSSRSSASAAGTSVRRRRRTTLPHRKRLADAEPWRLMTMPSYTWTRRRWPSITWKWTLTMLPP